MLRKVDLSTSINPDPFDLRKDLVVPLFNSDRTSLNEMIELDKPITLDDVERHFSLDYNFDDLPPIVSLTDGREYAENFTVFERFLGQEEDVEIVIIDQTVYDWTIA